MRLQGWQCPPRMRGSHNVTPNACSHLPQILRGRAVGPNEHLCEGRGFYSPRAPSPHSPHFSISSCSSILQPQLLSKAPATLGRGQRGNEHSPGPEASLGAVRVWEGLD